MFLIYNQLSRSLIAIFSVYDVAIALPDVQNGKPLYYLLADFSVQVCVCGCVPVKQALTMARVCVRQAYTETYDAMVSLAAVACTVYIIGIPLTAVILLVTRHRGGKGIPGAWRLVKGVVRRAALRFAKSCCCGCRCLACCCRCRRPQRNTAPVGGVASTRLPSFRCTHALWLCGCVTACVTAGAAGAAYFGPAGGEEYGAHEHTKPDPITPWSEPRLRWSVS